MRSRGGAWAVGLGRAVGEAHRRYTNFINGRGRWTGHLFQRRFGSVVMDDAHLAAAAFYVALNPVRARLARRAVDWPWSSVRAHLTGEDDELVSVRPLLDRIADFSDQLEVAERDAGGWETAFSALRLSEGTAVRWARPISSPTSNACWAGLWRAGRPAASHQHARRTN